MSKVLITLANDESYLVSEETARRVEAAIPADRRVTVTPVKDVPDHPLLGQQKTSTVFEREQQKHHPPTDHEKALAKRWAAHMAKRQQPAKQK
jgi:hypothetical protein